MHRIVVEDMCQPPVASHQVEVVERKGIGHPDSICDAVMEEISIALSAEYQARFGRILHYNIDKGLLVAGQVERAFGGGVVVKPMRLIVGDRATFAAGSEVVDVEEIVDKNARRWVRDNLRHVDSIKHLNVESALRPGSTELTDIFLRGGEMLPANDTSAAVGYAPMTDTESLVYAMERYINSDGFKVEHPAAGEDVKVMGYREGGSLLLTVALAIIDRYVDEEDTYWSIKDSISKDIADFAERNKGSLNEVKVDLNTLDERGRGMGGIYLSVTGTSAEDADSGQVGRGNRVNGVIALNRPSGMEAAAGKNPASHVGKIYSILAHKIAREVRAGADGIAEVYVWLASQVGRPVDKPRVASAQLVLEAGKELADVEEKVKEIIDFELAVPQMEIFIDDLVAGRYRVW